MPFEFQLGLLKTAFDLISKEGVWVKVVWSTMIALSNSRSFDLLLVDHMFLIGEFKISHYDILVCSSRSILQLPETE